MTRVGSGGGGGDDPLNWLKLLFGTDTAQWVRFMMLGAGMAAAYFMVQDFRQELLAESQAVRRSLTEYIAANEKWQDLTVQERNALIRKADVRFRRLYIHNGWEYQGLTE